MTDERLQAECPKCHQRNHALLEAVGEGGKYPELDCPHFAFRIDPFESEELTMEPVIGWASYGHAHIPAEEAEKARRAVEQAVNDTLERVGYFFFGDETERAELGRRLAALFGPKWRDRP